MYCFFNLIYLFIMVDFDQSTVVIGDQTIGFVQSQVFTVFSCSSAYFVCLAILQTGNSVSLCFYDLFLVDYTYKFPVCGFFFLWFCFGDEKSACGAQLF